MTKFWWVNQGQSYREEREGGFLWAPLTDARGRRILYWDSMDELLPGDVVVHYANQAVQALGVVDEPASMTLRPESLPKDFWTDDGRLVRMTYFDLPTPIHRLEIPLDWRTSEAGKGRAFRKDGEVNLGYLFPLSPEFASRLQTKFTDRLPAVGNDSASRTLPAEARLEAVPLLRSLIGKPLATVTGKRNTILGVDQLNVVVSSGKSPDGAPVPIEWVQSALDELRTHRQVTLREGEWARRSAFIGAVLLSLPGTTADELPARILLEQGSGAWEFDDADSALFDGELAAEATVQVRGEQASLRKVLVGGADRAACQVCGEVFPVRFLWAAHIKKRAVCTDDERRDLRHIAMLACTFGCDALFEAGYLSVDASGFIRTASTDLDSLRTRLEPLEGRRCIAFTTQRSPYFAWHRENTWLG